MNRKYTQFIICTVQIEGLFLINQIKRNENANMIWVSKFLKITPTVPLELLTMMSEKITLLCEIKSLTYKIAQISTSTKNQLNNIHNHKYSCIVYKG